MKNYISKILFLGCNFDQLPYLNEIKKKGFYVVGADLNPNAPGKALCDKFYSVGYDDISGLIEIGKKEDFNSKDKIFTAAAQFANLGAAYFAREFQIPFPKIEAIEICLDKAKFYPFFKEHNLPIPETFFINNNEELIKGIDKLGSDSEYYLKSDFSKNPNYVYKFTGNKMHEMNFFWGRDRYLQKCYILQKEFLGEHLRINIIGDNFILFPVDLKNKLVTKKAEIVSRGILKKLKAVILSLGFNKLLVKFDLILNHKGYVVLDIGIDPPYRLNLFYTSLNLQMPHYYVNQYLENEINYPILSYES